MYYIMIYHFRTITVAVLVMGHMAKIVESTLICTNQKNTIDYLRWCQDVKCNIFTFFQLL